MGCGASADVGHSNHGHSSAARPVATSLDEIICQRATAMRYVLDEETRQISQNDSPKGASGPRSPTKFSESSDDSVGPSLALRGGTSAPTPASGTPSTEPAKGGGGGGGAAATSTTGEASKVAHTEGPLPSLNIIIILVGSRGDVQPFIAFALGLMAKGHRVRIATHSCFRDFVLSQGIDYFPIMGDPAELMRFMTEHPDLITLNPREIEAAKHLMSSIYNSTYLACTTPTQTESYRPDVIIANPPVHAHIHLAEKLHVPLQIMFTMPWSATDAYQHPLASIGAGVLYGNKKSYLVVEQMIWTGCSSQINQFRKDVLGLPAVYNGAGLIDRAQIAQTYCMSSALVPKPTDWGSHINIVGFWFLDLKSNFKPESEVPELLKFIHGGSPPLYVGFGSIVVDDPQSLSRRVVDGVLKSGVRAIIHQGWAKLGEGMPSNPNIFILKDAVPHDWLFPLCSAVCHHGGAGTVAAGLRVGRPTIVVPFFGDQPFWGSCVAQRNVGPQPIPHQKLNEDNLAQAIAFCMKPATIVAAVELGKKIRNEDGVPAGITAFERNLPFKNGQWKCEVYQNQRWYPGSGWSNKLLYTDRSRYSDRTGTISRDMDSFILPPGWKWDVPWEIYKSAAKTDSEGWEYAINFDRPFHSKSSVTDCVRRRRWLRFRSVDAHFNLTTHPETRRISQDMMLMAPASKSRAIVFYVTVDKGVGLKPCDILSASSDPFVRLYLRRNVKELQSQRTKIVRHSLDPKWDQRFFFICEPGDVLCLECWDWDLANDDLIGRAELRLDDFNLTLLTRTDLCVHLDDGGGDLFLVIERTDN